MNIKDTLDLLEACLTARDIHSATKLYESCGDLKYFKPNKQTYPLSAYFIRFQNNKVKVHRATTLSSCNELLKAQDITRVRTVFKEWDNLGLKKVVLDDAEKLRFPYLNVFLLVRE